MVNSFEYFGSASSFQNSIYGVISTLTSRPLDTIKSNTVILMENHHDKNNIKYQGLSWMSALGNNGDYTDMYTYHWKSLYNFLYEDGHVEGNMKSTLMQDNKELLRAID